MIKTAWKGRSPFDAIKIQFCSSDTGDSTNAK
ncbi:hypothetical protein [Mucilaginibacter gynuensis]